MRQEPGKGEVDLQKGWAAGWDRRRFRELARNPEFHALVTLARLANMLRFVYSVSIRVKGRGPEARRQSTNAFYLSGALLVEAAHTIQGVGSYFSEQTDFIELARSVHSAEFERAVGRFRGFRNQAGFHFDPQPTAAGLKKTAERGSDFVAFLTAYGDVSKDMYYDLGDEVAMDLILGQDDYGPWLEDWFGLSAKVMNQVVAALETFIADRLQELEPEIVSTKDDTPLEHR